jgi:hypothetical protein
MLNVAIFVKIQGAPRGRINLAGPSKFDAETQTGLFALEDGAAHVRFWHIADIRYCTAHVAYDPKQTCLEDQDIDSAPTLSHLNRAS